MCWRKEERQGTFTKVPYNARTGNKAQSDNPATWASYAQAVQALRTGTYHGLGYVFHRDYTGIDLDHCVNRMDSIDPWAQAYLDRLGSYAEYSPSKTGVHILVRGTIPSGLRRRVPHAPHPTKPPSRCTVNGATSPSPATMWPERQRRLKHVPNLHALHADLTAPKPTQQASALRTGQSALDDAAVLDKALHASNGATFRALWDGDTSGYVSPSEADLALCHLLAFWTTKMPRRSIVCFVVPRCTVQRSGIVRHAAGKPMVREPLHAPLPAVSETYTPHAHSKIIQFRRKPQGHL